MRPFQTSVTVDRFRTVQVSDVPFEAGERVDILILPRRNREDLARRMQALFRETQALPQAQALTDEEIAAEIDAHRSGE